MFRWVLDRGRVESGEGEGEIRHRSDSLNVKRTRTSDTRTRNDKGDGLYERGSRGRVVGLSRKGGG